MTQYMLSVHHTADEAVPTQEEIEQAFAAVDAFNTRMQEEGRWVFAGGLEARDTATTVRVEDGEAIITDGPFAEGREWLGGFWVLEAPDLDTALAIARDASVACAAPVEVRPFQGE